MRFIHQDANTIYSAIRRGANISKDGPMLGYRCKEQPGEPFVWLSYNEVIKRASRIGRAMRAIGIPSGQEQFIGIFAKNRPEWILVEQATYCFKNVIGMQIIFTNNFPYLNFSSTLRNIGTGCLGIHHQSSRNQVGGKYYSF